MSRSITLRIPAPLRSFTSNQSSVAVEGDTVDAALASLIDRFPALGPHLFDDEGALRSFVNLYRNDEDIRQLDRGRTALRDGDELLIVPSIAGGAPDVAPAEARGLTQRELVRYSRHLLLPEVGMNGQQKLRESSVLLVGAGGLGSPLALYLAAAGVGRLGIVDFDVVDETNLQRQILHGTSDVGRTKLASATDRLQEINPHVEVVPFETRLTSENALEVLSGFDVVADGTDNFPTRYLVNDASVLAGVPNVYASIFRFDGQVSVFGTPDGPCYRCLYPEPPPPGLVPSCAEGGVLGVLPGIVGTLQATEVIKLLLGIGEPLVGRLLLFDALDMRFQTLKLARDPECPVCGDHPTQTGLIDYVQFCGLGPDGAEDSVPEISVAEYKGRLDRGDDLVLLDVRRPEEVSIASIGGTLIPIDDLEDRMGELEGVRDREIVVYCRTGARSARAVRLLERHGFLGARNLAGGIHAWSEEIDPAVARY